MDGTLIDSEHSYHQIVENVLKKYGHHYSPELKKECHGGTDFGISQKLVKILKLPMPAEVLQEEIIVESCKVLPGAPLKRGAERLLYHLHEHKILTAIATNSTQKAIRAFEKKRPAFFALFHHKVSVSDPEVFRGKPQPDLFFVAAQRFPTKPKPMDCLVFEDSPAGVEAARQAGMQVVMIPDENMERSTTLNATLVIPNFLHFKPELFGLPPFKDNVSGKV